MDGTLLKKNKKVDEEIYKILPILKERGIKFVVASGRQYGSLQKMFLEYPEVIFVAENGGVILEGEEELNATYMSLEHTKHCLEILERIPYLMPVVGGKYKTYTKHQYVYDLFSSPIFNYNMEVVEDLSIIEDCLKITAFVKEEEERDILKDCKEIHQYLDKQLTVMSSGKRCLDIGLKTSSKGEAIRFLQKQWGITPEETMVFGDEQNDIPMFACAKYSYAMEEATDYVKSHANFVAKSHDAGGVVSAIWEHILKEQESNKEQEKER